MKKPLVTGAILSATISVFAQGAVLFDNYYNAVGNAIWLYPGNVGSGLLNPIGAGSNLGGDTWHVALLYSATPGGGLPQSSLSEVADYVPNVADGNGNGPGYFMDESGGRETTIILPGPYSPSGTFEVASWLGSDTTWATAENDPNTLAATWGANLVEFTDAHIANLSSTPFVPEPISVEGWDGNLNLFVSSAPEPTTIALGGLGTAALLLFRRRK